ncbi:MAG: undecaprenyl-diphosphate phosphatase [Nitrospirae bacterium]|nr:undecaprenyl-diphosphate phosphatase [Nitrospirota bacterium]
MIEAIILGITQGLTEFFPVSSTAHLILLPWFFGWEGDVNTLTFDVALHGGTLTALIFCFWKDWIELFFKKKKLLGMIIFSSIPAGIAGFLLNDIVEKKLREPFLISVMLITVGFIMLASEGSKKKKEIENIDLKDALFIGIAQATALIPGVSRSGVTIAAGLFKGLKRDVAARFSFLLSTPIIAGATALHLKKFLDFKAHYNLQLFTAGFLTSSIIGLIAIKFLMSFLRKYPLNLFVYYRFALAVVIIAGIWLKG